MKSLTLLSLLVACQLSFAQQDVSQRIHQELKWLEGKWERQGMKKGTSGLEYWLFDNNRLHGKGISFQETDTVFVEGLSIQLKKGKAYYVAEVPGNNAPTFFEIKTIFETGFISENLAHDFPKRIQYELTNDLLTVVISDGGSKKMTFEFVKFKQ